MHRPITVLFMRMKLFFLLPTVTFGVFCVNLPGIYFFPYKWGGIKKLFVGETVRKFIQNTLKLIKKKNCFVQVFMWVAYRKNVPLIFGSGCLSMTGEVLPLAVCPMVALIG